MKTEEPDIRRLPSADHRVGRVFGEDSGGVGTP